MLERVEDIITLPSEPSQRALSTQDGLILLENVQFIYELSLAQMELESLGVKFEVTNGLRRFKMLEWDDETLLKKRLAYFESVNGIPTDYSRIIRKNQTSSVNQYLTHWIYPYKGKFHPQMVRALLNVIGLKKGDTVLDPFVGSGTTALEAQLMGINCVGVDVSMLCVLQSKVKTQSVEVLDGITEMREEILGISASGVFGSQDSLNKAIASISNEKVKNFYTMAKLIAVSDQARRGRSFYKSFEENLEQMIRSVSDYAEVVHEVGLNLGHAEIQQGDARSLELKDGSIDGIITSPPYSIALDYVENDAHSLSELGYDINKIRAEFVGVRGSGRERIEFYDHDLERSLAEMQRVLATGRYAAIVIGNASYQGQELQTVEFTIKEAERVGLKLVKNVNKIIFGLYNVMRKENILVFRKS
jgi:DNA modification methylase